MDYFRAGYAFRQALRRAISRNMHKFLEMVEEDVRFATELALRKWEPPEEIDEVISHFWEEVTISEITLGATGMIIRCNPPK